MTKLELADFYHPNGEIYIFLVVLPFFRLFRYGKKDFSRFRTRLFPCTPNVVVVKHVVGIPIAFYGEQLTSFNHCIAVNKEKSVKNFIAWIVFKVLKTTITYLVIKETLSTLPFRKPSSESNHLTWSETSKRILVTKMQRVSVKQG